MIDCAIALGGNQGNVADCFDQAIALLRDHEQVNVIAISTIHQTAAVGSDAGEQFLNAAARIETSLSALELLDALQSIEDQLGRKRDLRWGPRTLDLDLLLYGDNVIRTPRLTVPHPGCWYRRFVLDPLCEVAAEMIHPEKRVPMADLQHRLLTRPLTLGLANASNCESIKADIETQFADVTVNQWQSGDSEPTLLFDFDEKEQDASQLPSLPRIEVTPNANPATFMAEVVQSALG